MLSLNTQTNSSRSNNKVPPNSISDRDTPVSPEDFKTVAMLTALYVEVEQIQRRIDALEPADHKTESEKSLRRSSSFPDPVTDRTEYSPIVKIAFEALKFLFLVFAGFALAYVLSVGLRAPYSVIDALHDLASGWLLPLTALTFCAIAVASLNESLK